MGVMFDALAKEVRMAERSKALRSGRSPLLWAWVRIPLLTLILFFPEIPYDYGSSFIETAPVA